MKFAVDITYFNQDGNMIDSGVLLDTDMLDIERGNGASERELVHQLVDELFDKSAENPNTQDHDTALTIRSVSD